MGRNEYGNAAENRLHTLLVYLRDEAVSERLSGNHRKSDSMMGAADQAKRIGGVEGIRM